MSISLTGLVWTLLAIPSPDIPFEVILQVLPLLGFLIAVVSYYASVFIKPLANLSASTLFWMQFSGLVALGYIDGLRTLGERNDLESYWYITILILSLMIGVGIVLNRKYALLNRVLLISCLLLLLLYYHPTLFLMVKRIITIFGRALRLLHGGKRMIYVLLF